MKKLKKKLVLNKITLANLNSQEKNAIRGGLTVMTNCAITCDEKSCDYPSACPSVACTVRPCTSTC
jgi:hypothetical protein